MLRIDISFFSFRFTFYNQAALMGKGWHCSSHRDGNMILSHPMDLASSELME